MFRRNTSSLASLTVLAFTACSGAPAPPQIISPIATAATAEPVDAGTAPPAPGAEAAADPSEPPLNPPASAEPSGTAIDPPQPPVSTVALSPPGAPAAAPAPQSACEILRAVKNARPLFARPPLPCERADRILYYRRDADDACGPRSALTVTAAGVATLDSASAADAPATGGACPKPTTSRIVLEPDAAQRLVASACAAFNADYSLERGVGCRTAAVRLFFFAGEEKLGETAALPCPPHALDRVVAELEALASAFD